MFVWLSNQSKKVWKITRKLRKNYVWCLATEPRFFPFFIFKWFFGWRDRRGFLVPHDIALSNNQVTIRREEKKKHTRRNCFVRIDRGSSRECQHCQVRFAHNRIGPVKKGSSSCKPITWSWTIPFRLFLSLFLSFLALLYDCIWFNIVAYVVVVNGIPFLSFCRRRRPFSLIFHFCYYAVFSR